MSFFYFPKSVCCRPFVQVGEALSLFIFRSATRNAARSVPSPMGRTAATAHAAITHVWYEFGLFLKVLQHKMLIYTSETLI